MFIAQMLMNVPENTTSRRTFRASGRSSGNDSANAHLNSPAFNHAGLSADGQQTAGLTLPGTVQALTAALTSRRSPPESQTRREYLRLADD